MGHAQPLRREVEEGLVLQEVERVVGRGTLEVGCIESSTLERVEVCNEESFIVSFPSLTKCGS